MTLSLEKVLRTRAIVTEIEFPYVVKLPYDLTDVKTVEINDWLENNCHDRFRVRNDVFRFSSNADFMLFTMKWYDHH